MAGLLLDALDDGEDRAASNATADTQPIPRRPEQLTNVPDGVQSHVRARVPRTLLAEVLPRGTAQDPCYASNRIGSSLVIFNIVQAYLQPHSSRGLNATHNKQTRTNIYEVTKLKASLPKLERTSGPKNGRA